MPLIEISSNGEALELNPATLRIKAGESIRWHNATDVDCKVTVSIMSMLVPAGKSSKPIRVTAAGSSTYTASASGYASAEGSIEVRAALELDDAPVEVVEISLDDSGTIVVDPSTLTVAIGQLFEWQNLADVEMTLIFPTLEIPIPANSTSDQFDGETYAQLTYTVSEPSGQSIDPEIIIGDTMGDRP